MFQARTLKNIHNSRRQQLVQLRWFFSGKSFNDSCGVVEGKQHQVNQSSHVRIWNNKWLLSSRDYPKYISIKKLLRFFYGTRNDIRIILNGFWVFRLHKEIHIIFIRNMENVFPKNITRSLFLSFFGEENLSGIYDFWTRRWMEWFLKYLLIMTKAT